ncbi:hypothetical protein ADIAL_0919 [Alkalibacterium sp. AK22]|uniref:DUF3221 domain-containing protein n=1 Tax=Alkalibacterium sp. AK22 TaxID=1229520 RepID=UPI00044E795B|nr:DUF3221 domain-containing protein [Alkalibacterium sp. AK22]EXJ23656.1 hypothetical protein ADIAL_0919 [Alkalibacterium sp. AK22]
MKRLLIFITVLLLAAAGCGLPDEHAHFSGTVTNVDGQQLIVEPDAEEAIRDSGAAVAITVPDSQHFQTGDRVVVTYEGEIMESYPLQIRLIAIEKEQ